MLIQCHECGAQVSTEARACMQCGAPPKRTSEIKHSGIDAIEDDFVSFKDALYRTTCPVCEKFLIVKGITLSSKETLKCPHLHLGAKNQLVSVKNIKEIKLDCGRVVYRRLKDFYSYHGRLSVADYWLSLIIALPVIFIVGIAGFGAPLVFFGLLHPLWIKRYHDQGMSGEWVTVQGFGALTSSIMFLLMPEVIKSGTSLTVFIFGIVHGITMIACIITGFMISFIPGKPKTNRYGPPKSDVKRTWW